LQKLSELFVKTTIEQQNNTKTIQVKNQEKKDTIAVIEGVLKDIDNQKIVTDYAERTLNLERTIKNYENDRQKLKLGEPCFLCGATEHPYIVNLKKVDVSKTEKEYNNEKDSLQKLIETKNKAEQKRVKIKAEISHLKDLKNKLKKQLTTILEEEKELKIACEITNTVRIKTELKKLHTQWKALEESIDKAQELQKKKDKLADLITVKSREISDLETVNATLVEKLKNGNVEKINKEKALVKTTGICAELEVQLQHSLAKFSYELPTLENANEFISSVETSIALYKKQEEKSIRLHTELETLNFKIAHNLKEFESKLKEKNSLLKIVSESQSNILTKTAKRIAILPIKTSVEEKRNALEELQSTLMRKIDLNKEALQKSVLLQTEKLALKINETKERDKLAKELAIKTNEIDQRITNSSFVSKKEVMHALLEEEDKIRITKISERIKENLIAIETKKKGNEQHREILHKSKNFEIGSVENTQRLKELKESNENYLTRSGEIAESFRKDKEIRDRNKEIYVAINSQEKICATWKQLFALIGNSKEAFNVYVQRLTLEHLLDLANVHLYNLDKRYSLKMESDYKAKEELNFNLIDHYQTGQARLVDTSSGGEKFIISLALALGLSDLASKNVRIDSLFIDEGFGTLDNHTLERVISTLETLQSQGKMIGIISHVENLKERISTQIQINKGSNGISTVRVV